MSKKSTGNIATCIIAAKQFLEVAEMLTTNDQCDVHFVRPFFVNAGISCELFLKAIQMIESDESTFEKGHKLNDLFSLISESAKKDILCLYNTYYQNIKKKLELNSFLSSYPEPFVDFRYTFEESAVGNSLALLFFARSLRTYCEKIFNESDCQ